MDRPALNDPDVFPSSEVLADCLAESYPAYLELLRRLDATFKVAPEWRFYRDGKAWLAKVVRKKTTLAWLAARDGYVTATCYFTDRTAPGVRDLDIAAETKAAFASASTSGKLHPLSIEVRDASAVQDVLTVLAYKSSLR